VSRVAKVGREVPGADPDVEHRDAKVLLAVHFSEEFEAEQTA